jgi:hypothetical protein
MMPSTVGPSSRSSFMSSDMRMAVPYLCTRKPIAHASTTQMGTMAMSGFSRLRGAGAGSGAGDAAVVSSVDPSVGIAERALRRGI